MVRLRRASESQWRRRVLELATFLAEEALANDLFERFLATLYEDVPATTAVLDYDAHENRTEFVTFRLDAPARLAYSEHYHAINPFTRAILQNHLVNGTYIGSHWVDQRAYLRSEYYDGFVRPRGDRYFLAISISHPDGGRTGIPLYRGDSEGGEFTSEEARRLDMLRPFLANALLLRRLHRRFSIANLPIVQRNADGNCEPCNDAAESLLRDEAESRRLQATHIEFRGKDVVIPHLRPDAPSVFARRYGLTKRESQVAALLCDGLSYEEVALRLLISYHTVNGHVKSLLRKLNLSSSRSLPRLLMAYDTNDDPSSQSF